jgi:hypothetical protein
VAYHLVAVDFLPSAVIQASLARLAAEFASGGPTHKYVWCTSWRARSYGHASPLRLACMHVREQVSTFPE